MIMVRSGFLLAFLTALTITSSAGALPTRQGESGGSCEIDLPSGLKEPGTCADAGCVTCRSVFQNTCYVRWTVKQASPYFVHQRPVQAAIVTTGPRGANPTATVGSRNGPNPRKSAAAPAAAATKLLESWGKQRRIDPLRRRMGGQIGPGGILSRGIGWLVKHTAALASPYDHARPLSLFRRNAVGATGVQGGDFFRVE